MPAGTRALRRAYKAIRHAFPVARLYWVKGHTDIEGNERADKAAKAGAERSRDAPAGSPFPVTDTKWDTPVPPGPWS